MHAYALLNILISNNISVKQQSVSSMAVTRWSEAAPPGRADRTPALFPSGPAAPHTRSCSPYGSSQSRC